MDIKSLSIEELMSLNEDCKNEIIQRIGKVLEKFCKNTIHFKIDEEHFNPEEFNEISCSKIEDKYNVQLIDNLFRIWDAESFSIKDLKKIYEKIVERIKNGNIS